MASEELERLHRAYLDRHASKAQREAAWNALDDFSRALVTKLPFKWQALEANIISHAFLDCRVHIYVLEDIQFGRLKRIRGSFLCASNAQNYTRADGEHINCKTCLERAKRIVSHLENQTGEQR